MKHSQLSRWFAIVAAIAVVLILGAKAQQAWQDNPAHEMRDVVQERLNVAPPPLEEIEAISQTFVCNKNGLHAIEVMLVVFDTTTPLPQDGLITLRLYDEEGKGPILSSLSTDGLAHNQRIRFDFAPQSDSKGKQYRMILQATNVRGITFWVTDREAYAGGQVATKQKPLPKQGDLYFVTYGNYALREAVADAWHGLGDWAHKLPAALALLVMPGLAIWSWLWPGRWRRTGVSAAVVLALSMASWPLILLWTSLAGITMSTPSVQSLSLGWTMLAAWGLWRRRSTMGPLPRPRTWLPDLALVLVMVMVFATRWWQVRELVVPAWVDSHHHSLITKIIAEGGRIPLSLRPYAELDNFHYHFGFHANAAVLTWLTGLAPWQAVMLLGQWFNALAAVAAAGLAVAWSRRFGASGSRWAAPIAAVVVALIAFMPAYYVSWGRYTQLTGLVLLPGLLIASDDLLHPGMTPRSRQGMALVVGILLAGMGVTHYRVLVFLILWAPLAVALAWLRFKNLHAAWYDMGFSLLTMAAVTALLLLPWIWRFSSLVLPTVGTQYGGMTSSPGSDSSFPTGLLDVGHTRLLIKLAIVGAGWALVRGRWRLALLVPWAGLCFLVANPSVLGLPNIWLIHNSSVFISFWLPVGVLIGWLVADLYGLLMSMLTLAIGRWGDPAPVLGWVALGATLWIGSTFAWGIMVNVVNPTTELVTQEDRVAISWCARNLPDDALVLINAGRWQDELRAGTDAGWWLPILADVQVTLPPVLYGQGEPGYVNRVNSLAQKVEDAESLDDPALLDRLYAEGVTHVFSGAKGGRLMPKDLDDNPAYELVYAYGASRVYALR